MRFRPWRSQGFVVAKPSNGKAVATLDRPPEPTAEAPALAEGPAAEDERNIDPTPNGDVAPEPGRDRSKGETRAPSDPQHLPRWRSRCLTARHCNDSAGVETKRGTGGGAFEERGVPRVPNDSIRDRRREPVGRTTRRNAVALETWPSPILDGGPAAGVEDLDHDVGMNRSRSPGLRRAGGSAAGSNSRRAVRPMRFHPPGLSAA